MSPKPKYLPFLFLSLTALALYSFSHSSLHLFSQPQTPDSNLKPLTPRNPNPPNFTLTIKVLAYDRLPSLSRCLGSLAAADYGADTVDLHVFIDHFQIAYPRNGSLYLDEKIDGSRRILEFVDGFVWKFGKKLVHYRTGNVGLQAQWLEAWWPGSDDEFAFVVEDDLELSPLYYGFLKGLILRYYYDKENFSPMVYGASLQRPRFVAGKHGNKLQLDSGTRLFLYQMVGTWGQLLFPKPWKEFRLWYDEHKTKGIKPILQGMVTTGWYKKMGEKIWTPWFIKFIHSRGYYNIYTNFLRERALSTSHRDAGVNYGKTAGPDSYLLNKSSLDFDLWEMPPLRNLKWYDFCFSEVSPERVVRSLDELGYALSSVQKKSIVIFVSLYKTTQMITRNLLCHFQRLDIRNYIFLGPDSEFLMDLARRGHPVIDAGHLMNEIRMYKLMGLQGSNKELMKEVLVKAYVIKKCLESGFHSWMIDGNVLPVDEAFPEMGALSSDFSVMSSAEILFVKSSHTSKKIWVDNFIYKIASTTESLTGRDSLSRDQRLFVDVSAKSLEEKGANIKGIDETSVGVELDGTHFNHTSHESGKKMVFWPFEMGLDSVHRELEDLGLWVVAGDGSCAAVFCHQS
ncbi:hypothetical protein AAC387_Pa03g1321 [Persea americana]